MKTLMAVVGIVIGVGLCYIPLTIMMPFLSGTAFDAAANMSANPHAAAFVGVVPATNYAPFALYFVPPIIGGIFVVKVLRSDRD